MQDNEGFLAVPVRRKGSSKNDKPAILVFNKAIIDHFEPPLPQNQNRALICMVGGNAYIPTLNFEEILIEFNKPSVKQKFWPKMIDGKAVGADPEKGWPDEDG